MSKTEQAKQLRPWPLAPAHGLTHKGRPQCRDREITRANDLAEIYLIDLLTTGAKQPEPRLSGPHGRWVLVLAGLSMGFAWADQQTIVRILHLAILLLNAAICSGVVGGQKTE